MTRWCDSAIASFIVISKVVRNLVKVDAIAYAQTGPDIWLMRMTLALSRKGERVRRDSPITFCTFLSRKFF